MSPLQKTLLVRFGFLFSFQQFNSSFTCLVNVFISNWSHCCCFSKSARSSRPSYNFYTSYILC